MKRPPQRIYFDCNAFDRVALDPSLCHRLTKAAEQGIVALCLSPVNVDELFGIVLQPNGRSRVEDILGRLGPCFHDRVLRDPADIFNQAGQVVQGKLERIHYFESSDNHAYRPGNALYGISKLPEEELVKVVAGIREAKKDTRRFDKSLQAEIGRKVNERPDLHADLTFEEVLELTPDFRDIGFRVSHPLSNDPRLLGKARRSPTHALAMRENGYQQVQVLRRVHHCVS